MELAFHRESLTDFLLEACAASAVTIVEIGRLHGGAVHENWQLTVEITGGSYEGEQNLVLRVDANSSIPMAWNRAQEFHILSAVFAAGVKAPEPLWLCEDPGVVGRPFYVMRLASGSADPRRLVKKTPEAIRRKTLADLGGELAKIHAIEPTQPSLGFLSAPTQPACLERVAYDRAYLDQLDRSYPALEWGLRWLERNALADPAVVFCHGDFRTGNYLASENGLIAVLDWELAHLGNPLEDIGYFCAKCWRFGVVEREAGGIGDVETLLQAYEQGSGRTINRRDVAYWQLLATVKWAIIALQQGERHITGKDESLELALTSHIVPELELQVLQQTESLSGKRKT